MKVHADFTIRDMLHELYKKSDDWHSCNDMRVGEWLEKIAVTLIKNDTCNNVVTSPSLREYGPEVSYDEMKNLLDDSFGCEEIRFDLAYNSGDSTWTIENFIVPASFYKAMENVKEDKEQDTNSYRHEIWIPKITVGEIFGGLFYGTGDTESKTIAQWLLQGAKEIIKNYCNREYLKDVTFTMESFLNLIGCGTLYSWEDIERILRLSDNEDRVIFALDVQGTNIKIANMELPDSMKNAIKKVHKEKEEDKKQHKEFSVGEMFTGLMLAKNYTVKQTYTEWLERAVQNLLNVKKEMPSDYSIRLTHGTKINFQDAIDDFVTHNRAGDKFKVIYSLSDECGAEGNSAIKFYDIKKVEE